MKNQVSSYYQEVDGYKRLFVVVAGQDSMFHIYRRNFKNNTSAKIYYTFESGYFLTEDDARFHIQHYIG